MKREMANDNDDDNETYPQDYTLYQGMGHTNKECIETRKEQKGDDNLTNQQNKIDNTSQRPAPSVKFTETNEEPTEDRSQKLISTKENSTQTTQQPEQNIITTAMEEMEQLLNDLSLIKPDPKDFEMKKTYYQVNMKNEKDTTSPKKKK